MYSLTKKSIKNLNAIDFSIRLQRKALPHISHSIPKTSTPVRPRIVIILSKQRKYNSRYLLRRSQRHVNVQKASFRFITPVKNLKTKKLVTTSPSLSSSSAKTKTLQAQIQPRNETRKSIVKRLRSLRSTIFQKLLRSGKRLRC